MNQKTNLTINIVQVEDFHDYYVKISIASYQLFNQLIKLMQTHLLSPQKSPKKKPLLPKGELLTELKINPEAKNKTNNQDSSDIYKNHSARIQNNRPSPIKIPNDIRKSQVINKSINKFHDPADNTNLLDGLLQQSQKMVRRQRLAYDRVKNGKQQIEKKVYGAETSSKQQYLSQLYDQAFNQNEFVNEGLQQVIDEVKRDIADEIKHQKLKIHKKRSLTKDDLPELQKLDKYRMLKIKEGQVKNKVGDLRLQMQAEYMKNKNKRKFNTVDILDQDYYSYNHPKTKQTQSFVRKLNQEKKEHLRKKQEYLIAKKQQQMRKRQQQSFLKDEERRKKHQLVRQKYEQQMMQQMEASRIRKAQQNQFKKWKNYYEQEKPLYQKKEQQFYVNHQIPKMQQMKQQLMRRKAMNQPIDAQEIQDHQMQYLEYKNDDRIRKRAQMQMMNEQEQQRIQQMNERLYKGKARYLVLQDMLEKRMQEDPKELNRDKKIRQLAYSQDLRQKNRLRNQTIKQLSARENRKSKVMVTRIRNAQGSLLLSNQNQARSRTLNLDTQSEKDPLKPYQQGIKNLVFVKQMIRQHAEKGNVKPRIRLVQQREDYQPNYLQDLKQKRKNLSMAKNIEHDIQQTTNHQSIKAKLHSLDQRVKQKQLQKKHHSINEHQAQAQIEQGYLASIKAKLKLLTNFD